MAFRIVLLTSSALQNDGLDVPVILQCRTPQETNPKGHWSRLAGPITGWMDFFRFLFWFLVFLGHLSIEPLCLVLPLMFSIHPPQDRMDLFTLSASSFPCEKSVMRLRMSDFLSLVQRFRPSLRLGVLV